MLTRIVRMRKMSYLNIQNCSQCSFGCALEVHKIWRVKCNGKCLKHMADASDCALALYHLKGGTADHLSSRLGLFMPKLACIQIITI